MKKQLGEENSKKVNSEEKVYKTFINSFYYLYEDAEYFRNLARKKNGFEKVQISRTALLLYVFSLEALINRVIDRFSTGSIRNFFKEREEKLTLLDKWFLVPILISEKKNKFDTSRYPYSHFAELVRLRNDFVHPKHNRVAYYRVYPKQKRFEGIQYNEIPKELKIKENDIVYRNTRIPKDPYSILPSHVDTAKKLVDDIIKELDRLLDGKIFKDKWIKQDTLILVYPPGSD